MCDRTFEFRQYVAALSKASSTPNTKRPNVLDPPGNRSQFQQVAAEIASGIHRNSLLLTELTKLIRKQGLFDDSSEHINHLILRIKNDLVDLNSKYDSLQQFLNLNKRKQDPHSQVLNHNMKVIGSLKNELNFATKSFQSTLELRLRKMKDDEDRKVKILGLGNSPNHLTPTIPPPNAPNASGNPNILTPMKLGTSPNTSITRPNSLFPNPYQAINNPMTTELGSYDHSSRQEQQQQLLISPPLSSQQYYQNREEAVLNIQQSIEELGSLFKNLSSVISEQQVMFDRIDADIENATENVVASQGLLMKAYERAASNSGLYMKISGLLLFFIIFFVLFLM